MRDYVDAGGGLFMASMELFSRLDEGGFTNFRKGILHVEDYDVDPGLGGVFGSDSLSMTSGIDVPLDFSEFPDFFIIPQDLSDTFRTTTDAAPILFDSAPPAIPWASATPSTGEDGTGRVVFFSFPFDAIPADGDVPTTASRSSVACSRSLLQAPADWPPSSWTARNTPSPPSDHHRGQ
jgi:hypothetical protein